jgi:hypothetical protein
MELYEKQIHAIVKSLKMEFYIWAVALVLLAVMSFLFGPSMPKLNLDTAIALQSILLLLMLTGLPGTFIWFRDRMKALLLVDDIALRLNRYETYSRIRQGVFFLFGFLILVLQVFTVMKGAPMLFLVVAVLTIFILPSRGRLMLEAGFLKPEEEEHEDEEDMGSE